MAVQLQPGITGNEWVGTKQFMATSISHEQHLLGAADIRQLAEEAGVSPTKKLGQNFVIDPGTVRRIVRAANLKPQAQVIEVGPGLGSLTLGLLESGATVNAVEIDPRLAAFLPTTVESYMPEAKDRLRVLGQDALTLTPQSSPYLNSANELTLVSNLPYNVATPIILTLLERFENLQSFLVMVQKEVADRLVATPGSKIYGAPSVKLAWYGQSSLAGNIGRNVFWPAPNVDSALVSFTRKPQSFDQDAVDSHLVFQLIDAAFAQRRKTLRAALHGFIDDTVFEQAHIDSKRRGETLTIQEFTQLAKISESRAQANVGK